VLDSGGTNIMAAGDKGFTGQSAGSWAKVITANGDEVPIYGQGHVSIDVGKYISKACMVLAENTLVPDLTGSLLSVRAVDHNSGTVVTFGDARCIRSDGDAGCSSGVLDKATDAGRVNDLEQYVLKVTAVKALATAASALIAG